MRPCLPALLLALALGACAAPPTQLASLASADLLNRLPPQIGPLPASGPARAEVSSASRLYRVTGAVAIASLGTPNAATVVPDGPDAPETWLMLERLTSTLVTTVQPVPPFGPWRREGDIRVQNQDGPPLRCTVLRRPRGDGAQVQYNCVTGLYARYLTLGVNVNHDAMNAQAAQTLAGNFTGNVARMLATGNGLVAPAVATGAELPPLPKAPVADDAVPQ